MLLECLKVRVFERLPVCRKITGTEEQMRCCSQGFTPCFICHSLNGLIHRRKQHLFQLSHFTFHNAYNRTAWLFGCSFVVVFICFLCFGIQAKNKKKESVTGQMLDYFEIMAIRLTALIWDIYFLNSSGDDCRYYRWRRQGRTRDKSICPYKVLYSQRKPIFSTALFVARPAPLMNSSLAGNLISSLTTGSKWSGDKGEEFAALPSLMVERRAAFMDVPLVSAAQSG